MNRKPHDKKAYNAMFQKIHRDWILNAPKEVRALWKKEKALSVSMNPAERIEYARIVDALVNLCL